jgi:hypothetical protein
MRRRVSGENSLLALKMPGFEFRIGVFSPFSKDAKSRLSTDMFKAMIFLALIFSAFARRDWPLFC